MEKKIYIILLWLCIVNIANAQDSPKFLMHSLQKGWRR